MLRKRGLEKYFGRDCVAQRDTDDSATRALVVAIWLDTTTHRRERHFASRNRRSQLRNVGMFDKDAFANTHSNPSGGSRSRTTALVRCAERVATVGEARL